MKLVLITLAVFAVSLGSAYPRFHPPTTFGLKEDIDEFIALIPTVEVQNIVFDYMANDAEVQDVMNYVVSDDFKGLLTDIEAIPEYKAFLAYLQDTGLNIYYYLNKIHEIIGMPEYVPKYSIKSARRGVGVRGMLDDIEAILPVQKIKDLYYKKLETSPAFANLITRMRGDEFKSIVEQLKQNPEYQQLVELAKEHGVDVELIREILKKIFGWSRTEKYIRMTRTLDDDLKDFLALIPVNEIAPIVFDYIANDLEVQKIMEYIQGEDFKNVIIDVDGIAEYINILNYLQSNGVDVYTAVNKLHEFLGIDPLPVPSKRGSVRRGTGLQGLLDDIAAILPIDELKALYEDKLKTSKEFAALVKLVEGAEFDQLVKNLMANSKYNEIIERLKKNGVDVEMIIDFLKKLFGFDRKVKQIRTVQHIKATRGLDEDFQEFIKLIPVDKVHAIAFDYAANDPEVMEATFYITQDPFRNLVVGIDHIPEYLNLLNFIQSQGVDIYKYVNLIHDQMELPHVVPPSFRVARSGKGLRGMVTDIEAVLPNDDIAALYKSKLETSPEYANFVAVLKSHEPRRLLNILIMNPTFYETILTFKRHGVDLVLIYELASKVFGWGQQL